jgi:aminoglycoside phosphotransferase (APT) family kinase protein
MNIVPSEKKLRALIVKMIPEWSEDSLLGFNYLEGGFTNNNFVFERCNRDLTEKYVLRSPVMAQPLQSRYKEFNLYQSLEANISPDLIAFDTHSGAMITRYIEGQLLVDSPPSCHEPDKLVGFIKSLHLSLPRAEKCYDLPSLLSAYVPKFNIKAFPEIRKLEQYASCHNDLNPWNIIVNSATWVTLDWESFGLNDPVFDIVTLCMGLNLTDKALQNSVEHFCGTLDRRRLHYNLISFWLRQWGWAKHQISKGNRKMGIIEQEKSSYIRIKELAESRVLEH